MSSYDVIIIGGGPGGLAAGIYAARAKLSTLIIEKSRVGGQAATTEEMENYPGFFQGTTGPQLTQAMYEHARHFGCQFCKDEVVDLELEGWEKVIVTKQGRYTAKAVIIATGAEPRTLGVKGEAELKGKGVSYCATCDADFFEDLEVVVVGNGDAAIEKAITSPVLPPKSPSWLSTTKACWTPPRLFRKGLLPTKKSTLSGTLSWRKSKATASSRRWSLRTSRRER